MQERTEFRPREAQKRHAAPRETLAEPFVLLLPQHFSPTAEQGRHLMGEMGVAPGVRRRPCGESEPDGAQGAPALGSLPGGDW